MDYCNYFAYGSNMSCKRLLKRVPSATKIGVYTLSGYKLIFHKIGMDCSAKCDAFYTGMDSDVVYGVLYTMETREKNVLDEAEGLGRGYEEKMVDLFSQTRGGASAFLYYATNINDAILPFCWYVHHVQYGAKEVGLPQSYVDKITKIKCVEDTDVQRDKLERSVYKG